MEASKSNKTPCPKCGNPLRLSGLPAGEQVRCPKCNGLITVGGGAASSTAKRTQKTKKQPSETPGRPVEPGPPQVVAVNPFEQREAGELPIAAPASANPSDVDDDDAYEPEIPLVPSTIVPQEVYLDANLGATKELRREVDSSGGDDLEVDRPAVPRQDDSDQYLESAKRRGIVREYFTPDPPRWTFLSGVFGYPWRGPNLGRWGVMSVFLSVAAIADAKAIEALGLLDGDLTMTTLPGLFIAVFAIAMTVLTVMFVAPCLQTAIQDTADGHDLPQDGTFPEWDQWAFMMVGWLSLGASAAALGYPLSLVVGPLAMAGSFVLLFPVLLLSALEADSYFFPISPPVLRSLGYLAGGWLAFYLVSGLLVGATAAAILAGVGSAPELTWLLAGPVLAAVALIYARLLGRLAWKASGTTMAPVEIKGDVDPDEIIETVKRAAEPKRKSKKRSRVKIVVPEEIDRHEPPSERPRINFHHRS